MSFFELGKLLQLFLMSFVSAIIDLSLGMGYGFTVTPAMLLLGYSPSEAVPPVLFTSFIGSLFSSFFNHRYKNVDFSVGGRALRIALFTGGLGVLGAIAGVVMSFNLPQNIIGIYIGVLVMASGLLVIYSKALVSGFSWPRMFVISAVGSINKGLTGSGFGPVITTGAILSGINEKASVSIQAFAEALVSIVGFSAYLIMQGNLDYSVIVSMSLGVILASPFAAVIMSKLKGDVMRVLVGVLALLIGAGTLLKYL